MRFNLIFYSFQKRTDEEGTVHGVPDLIIEILSPGNRKHDTLTKRDLYEKFGVMEYWIVDPETKECMGYELKDNTYKLLPAESGKIVSPLLEGTFEF